MSRSPRALLALAAVALCAAAAVPTLTGASRAARGARPNLAPVAASSLVTARLERIISHARMLPVGRHAVVHGARGSTSSTSSANWSGYADSASGDTWKQVSASWKEPTITCYAKQFEYALFWIGLDGWNDDTVEQDGSAALCYLGTAYYYTWWEMYPTYDVQLVGKTVKPGDTITASVVYTKSSGDYALTVKDTTTSGNNISKTEKCGSGLTCENSSAEWIGETPGTSRGLTPLPDFATWSVTAGRATLSTSSASAPISSFGNLAISMHSDNTYDLAKPGVLGSTGTTFTDTWQDSY